MPTPSGPTAVRILSPAERDKQMAGGHRVLSVLALLVAMAFTVSVLVRVPEHPRPQVVGPVDIVRQLRDAIDGGVPAAVEDILTDGAILTWPAGPPWDGPLSGSVELVTSNGQARLSHHHSAALEDFLAFYATLNSSTELYRCNVSDASVGPFYDTWVACDFSLDNDLIAALNDGSATPVGRIRFAVLGNRISTVLVESWDLTSSAFGYLRWIKDERPASYESVFAGRLTSPSYGAETAARLLQLADEYAAVD